MFKCLSLSLVTLIVENSYAHEHSSGIHFEAIVKIETWQQFLLMVYVWSRRALYLSAQLRASFCVEVWLVLKPTAQLSTLESVKDTFPFTLV